MPEELKEQTQEDRREETEELDEDEESRRSCLLPCTCQRRLLVCALCCGGMIVIHSMRVNVAMTVVTILDQNPHEKVGEMSGQLLPDVNWSATMVGFLHAIFYVGFVITQIPGGYWATKIPANRLFGLSILMSCILNLLLPITISDLGFAFTCAVRFVQGLFEGVTIPAMYRIIEQWSPKAERNSLASISLTGMYAGAIIGFPLDGAIMHYLSWQLVFYIHTIIGVVWFILWFVLVFEKPELDACMSKKEYAYIQEGRRDEDNEVAVPWASIFCSLPFWAVIVSHFVRSWMFFFLLTNEPAYINIFHFSIIENGIFSAGPHLLKVLASVTGGFIADAVIRKWSFSVTKMRKFFTCAGFGGEALACYMLAFVSNGYAAIGVLCIGVGMSGLTVVGWQINHLDLSPRHASVLVGISATFGTVGGIISPIVVGVMTQQQTLGNWQKVFALTGSVLAGGTIFYFFAASGEKQDWADYTGKENTSETLISKEQKSYNTLGSS